jgi:hypothetical protein
VKMRYVALFGLGYVLGSKAGRQRYEQIMGVVHELASRSGEQTAREQVFQYADALPLVDRAASVGPRTANGVLVGRTD